MAWLLAYHLAVSAFLLVVVMNVALNWRFFVLPLAAESETATAELPFVSVLIPARNEAKRIAPCLQSLLSQNYPKYELLVLDDHSEDNTADIVLAHGFMRNPGSSQRLLSGEPLPTRWTGKAWACHQLAAAARGAYLLFTDADTSHDPISLRIFVEHALRTNAGLLSVWPRQVTATWSEHAVIPLVYVLLLGALPHYLLYRLQRRPEFARNASAASLRTLGAANGQYMLFKRETYEAIGGHAAVRDHLVEDVALGRLVASRTAEGMRLLNSDGSKLVRCRMYHSFPEVWEGFTKNLRAAFAQSGSAFWLFGLLQTAGLFMPFVFTLVPTLAGRWWLLTASQVATICLLRIVMTVRFKTSWWGVIMHPLGQGLSLLIGLNSWRLSTQQGVTWKGRTYTMNNLPEDAVPRGVTTGEKPLDEVTGHDTPISDPRSEA